MGGWEGPETQTPASLGPPCSRVPTSASPGGLWEQPGALTAQPEASGWTWEGWKDEDGLSVLVLSPHPAHLSSIPRRHTLRSLDGGVSLAELSRHPAATSHLFLCNTREPHTPRTTLASSPSSRLLLVHLLTQPMAAPSPGLSHRSETCVP